MKKMLQTLLTLVAVTSVWLFSGTTAFAATTTTTQTTKIENFSEEEDCHFCDGEELTLKEKCEELIVKALTDEANLLADGYISKEVYLLQCEPFEEALDRIEVASEKELLEEYQSILLYHFDEICEEEADGMDVDVEFFNYILLEIIWAYDVL